jgi:DNA-binding MarR family transcriptional regulator
MDESLAHPQLRTSWINGRYTCICKYLSYSQFMHTQVESEPGVASLVARLMVIELPGGRGLKAWEALLRAHATLMRQLERDLDKETGLALADFDVLAQLAIAGGELRMTELADRALISRSGMTRRVARLVDVGLVRRASAGADARGVVVALTDAGVARLTETAPVHARAISDLFVARLDDQELAVLESALEKVTLECTFG